MDPELSKKIDRYLNGTATETERSEVQTWFEASGEDARQFYNNDPQQISEATERTLGLLQQRITGHTIASPARRRSYRYAIAASVLLAVAVGAYFGLRTKPAPPMAAVTPVFPGTQVAVLKSGSGKVIALNGTNGLLAELDQAEVSKNGDMLIYNPHISSISTLIYDTLQVPAGGRPYHLQLADGSRILLNTATTLCFPQSMTEHNRGKLQLISGEIYAEVVHNPSAPLLVQTPAQQIEDIGTKFDVSAYPDDPMAFTVLAEGSLKVNGQPLSPGEQALSGGGSMTVKPADVSLRTAWVSGVFRFNHTPLRDILREVGRWYDMQVIYQANNGNDTYSGIISREASLQRMLTIIGAGDVHYRIEGRKLIILP